MCFRAVIGRQECLPHRPWVALVQSFEKVVKSEIYRKNFAKISNAASGWAAGGCGGKAKKAKKIFSPPAKLIYANHSQDLNVGKKYGPIYIFLYEVS